MAECNCCKDDGNIRHVPRKRNYQKLVEVSVPAYGLVLSNRLKEDACLQRRPVCTAATLRRDGGTEVLPMPCPKFTPDDPHELVYQRRQGKKYCAMTKAEYERAPCRDCRKKAQDDSGMQRRLFEKDRQVDRGMERRGLEKDTRVDSAMEQRRFEKERHIYSEIQRKKMETDHRHGKNIQRLQGSGSGDDGYKKGQGGGGYLPKNGERYGRTGERRKMKGTEYVIFVDGSSSTTSDSVPSIQSSSSTHTRSSVASSSSSGDKASLRKGDKVTVCMPCVNKSKRGENFILKGDKLKVARKDQPKEKARQEDRSANTRTRNSGRCGKGSNIGKTVDYAYRCESRELIGSKMIISCDCVKRNGLQDQCRRTACRGRAPCLLTPWPDCWPSGGNSGVDKTRTIGVARYNPVVEYRQDKVMRSDGGNKLAFQPDGRRRH